MEQRAHSAARALLLVASTALLAGGIRLSEERTLESVARAVRSRPLDHAAAVTGWALRVLWERPADNRGELGQPRCSGRRL
jgi:hypothetical protein